MMKPKIKHFFIDFQEFAIAFDRNMQFYAWFQEYNFPFCMLQWMVICNNDANLPYFSWSSWNQRSAMKENLTIHRKQFFQKQIKIPFCILYIYFNLSWKWYKWLIEWWTTIIINYNFKNECFELVYKCGWNFRLMQTKRFKWSN